MIERVLPRHFPDTPEFMIFLSDQELRELGTFAALWSQVDFLLTFLISLISKTDLVTLQILMENMTLGAKVNTLKKFCQNNDLKEAKELIKICDTHSGLVEDRNHIFHGQWGVDWDQQTNETAVSCLYQKNKRKPILAEKLIVLSDRVALYSKQLGAVAQSLMSQPVPTPRLILFGEGPPSRPPPPWPPKSP